jgi:hypothetical protein
VSDRSPGTAALCTRPGSSIGPGFSSRLWVPKTSSRSVDLALSWRGTDGEGGLWLSPAFVRVSSLSASHGAAKQTSPWRWSSSATRSLSCADRWRVRHSCP